MTLISKVQVDRILSTKGEITPDEMKIADAYFEQLGFVNTTAKKVGTASIHIRKNPPGLYCSLSKFMNFE